MGVFICTSLNRLNTTLVIQAIYNITVVVKEFGLLGLKPNITWVNNLYKAEFLFHKERVFVVLTPTQLHHGENKSIFNEMMMTGCQATFDQNYIGIFYLGFFG